MTDDAQRPAGPSAPTYEGPQMYAFDGTPIDSSMPMVRADEPSIWTTSPSRATAGTSGTADDVPSDPDAPPIPETMPPARWPMSVVAVLFSLLFGALALYFSYQVGVRWRRGDRIGALNASKLVAVWSAVSLGVSVLGFLLVGAAAA